MPIRVPGTPQRQASMPVPSEVDLMMALAQMKKLGRIPSSPNSSFSSKLNPSLQGQVEDRREEGPSGATDEDLPDIANAAREVAGDRLAAGVKHGAENLGGADLREFIKMKARRYDGS